MVGKVSDEALDVLLRDARSYSDYKPDPVGDDTLRALYDLVKWGPTTANSQPLRILFIRSPEAKERLKPALSSSTTPVRGGWTPRCRWSSAK